MADAWAEVLGVKVDSIGMESNFFELGGQSTLLMTLQSEIKARMGIKVSLATLIKHPIIRDMEETIQCLLCEGKEGKEKKSRFKLKKKRRDSKERGKDKVCVSSSQKRMLMMQTMEPERHDYNVPSVYEVEGLDVRRLEEAVTWVVRRYEALHTVYEEGEDEQWRGRLMKTAKVKAREWRAKGRGEKERVVGEVLRQPFDLFSGVPPVRVDVVRVEGVEEGEKKKKKKKSGRNVDDVVVLNIHHVAIDGACIGKVKREIFRLYERGVEEAEKWGEVEWDYGDFAASEAEWAAEGEGWRE